MPRFGLTLFLGLVTAVAFGAPSFYSHLRETVPFLVSGPYLLALLPAVALFDAWVAKCQYEDHELTTVARSFAYNLGLQQDIRIVRDDRRSQAEIRRVWNEIQIPDRFIRAAGPGALHYAIARELIAKKWERSHGGHLWLPVKLLLSILCSAFPLLSPAFIAKPLVPYLDFVVLFAGAALASVPNRWLPTRESILDLDREALDLTRDEAGALEALATPAMNPKPVGKKPDAVPTAEERVNALRNRFGADLVTALATECD